jgi:predicted nuclease of predicted toxin-antitoxin system
LIDLLADENFDGFIVRGVLGRLPDLDIVRVQDVGLMSADDPTILEWAAREGRAILTHDVRTMTRFAYQRAARGEPMPGVFLLSRTLPVGQAIESIVLLLECSQEGEWEGQVRYLPL